DRAEYTEVLVKPVTPTRLISVVRAHLAPAPGSDRAPGHGKRILLVDDSPTQRRFDTQRFERAHFHVTTAANAEEALAVVDADHTDVVVTDVVMAGIDGFELCSRIRTS